MRLSFGVVATALASVAASQVPNRVGYQGRLLRADGTPETGVIGIFFALYDAASGGTALGCDQLQVALSDGYYAVLLGGTGGCGGTTPPIANAPFDGKDVYLELSVAGTTMSPRQRIGSVPYAFRAGTATHVRGGTIEASLATIGGSSGVSISSAGISVGPNAALDASGKATVATGTGLTGNGSTASPLAVDTTTIQARVTGNCPAGQAITAVSPTGTVTCQPTAVVSVVSARPASPATGLMIFNTATNALELFDGSRWNVVNTRGELAGLRVYYDAADSLSYPGAGTTWYDVSGNGVNATMVGGLTRGSLGGIPTMIFSGSGAGAQFSNTSLGTQAFTAIYWVYSQLTTTDTNQGGLYVNRTDTTANAADWVWFGKWSADVWYFRVNNGTCCQDLTGSGGSSWSANVPPGQWKMVHFAFGVGQPSGWKWGVNGLDVATATLPARPNSQTMSVSTIGYGHGGSGSYWNGGIASVRLYDRLLSQTEISGEFTRLRSRYGL